MSLYTRRIKTSLFLILLILCFTSCYNEEANRIDVSNSIEYIEVPNYYTLNAVSQLTDFKPLAKSDMHNLNKILEDPNNYLWLKIDFTIPDKLKYKNLGLFFARFKTANKAWINNIPCGSYGKFPPHEFSAGFGAQHFTLNAENLNPDGINTIYIKVWTGAPVNLNTSIFIGEEFDAFQTAERRTFFSSKIILCFACITFLAFIIYLLLYYFLRKHSKRKTYLYYSLLLLFSVVTLLPFCLYEVPWLKPTVLSYFTIMKILLSVGIYSTIYFVNKFMVSFLNETESNFIKINRIINYVFPLVGTLLIKNNNGIEKYIMWIFPFIFIEFIYTIFPLIRAFKNKKNRKTAIILLCSLIPAIIGFILDIVASRIGNIFVVLPYASIYGWQITSYIFILQLLKDFSIMYNKNIKLKNDMVKFNATLENEVELRTKELSEKNFILSRGLEAITLVQQEVLPKKNKTFMGWDISTDYIPLDNEVSGDLFDYYFIGSDLKGLSIIDVSGHGIPAGLMTILAKGIISQQYISGMQNSRSLTETLENINKIYIQEKVNVENYFTGLLFNFDHFDEDDNCAIQVANAGHPAPILYNSKTSQISEVKYEKPEEQYGFIGVDGFPISFPTTTFKMGINDILVCFTDGITEAMNDSKEEFSKKRLIKAIEEVKDKSAEEIRNNIMAALNEFIKDKPLSDDLTLLVLKRNYSKDYLEEI